MMIFRKAIPRRVFLRGLGGAMALPLLDAMTPAFASALDTAKPGTRLAYVYVPNGIMMDHWTPAPGKLGDNLPSVLGQLAAFKDQSIVISNLDGGPIIEGMGGGHPRATAMWLTGVDPKKSDHDVQTGVSVDQVAAREMGQQTQLSSLELGIENAAELVGAISGYAAAYVNTIAWRTPTTPLPVEHQPRAVFERLFGDGEAADPAARKARLAENRSLLDSVTRDVNRLLSDLGARDRQKLTQYLDAIRDLERRIQMAEQSTAATSPRMDRPVGIPAYDDHVKLMFDLWTLAWQADLTRVITFMMAREKSDLTYPQIGINESHHALSHNRGLQERMDLTARINEHQAGLFAYGLERLRATPDGDGSLLDHSVIVYGSGMGDGDLHTQQAMPTLVVGGGSGKLKNRGRHIVAAKNTPFTNLHRTVLEMVGTPIEKLGDSSAMFDLS